VEVLNGGGREPLGLAGRSLRRLERYSTRKRGVSLVLSDATTGPFVVVRQVLTFLLVRHEGWLRRRDLPFEFSKTCYFMQHFEGNGRIDGRLDQKNGFITGRDASPMASVHARAVPCKVGSEDGMTVRAAEYEWGE